MDIATAKRQIELWEKTAEWIRDNPELFQRFEELALEKAGANEKFGIGALTERVRWDFPQWAAARGLEGRRAQFKIPNECRRYIALALYEKHPHLESYCTTKRTIQVPEALTGRALLGAEHVVSDPAAVDPPITLEPFTDAALEDLDSLFESQG